MIAAIAIVAGMASAMAVPNPQPQPSATRMVLRISAPAPIASFARPDMSTWDPQHPPAEWLDAKVRPCARSGNRLVC